MQLQVTYHRCLSVWVFMRYRRSASHWLIATVLTALVLGLSARAQNFQPQVGGELAYLTDLEELLLRHENGGAVLIAAIRDVALSKPDRLSEIIDLLAVANPSQAAAIGTGLGQVAITAVQTNQAYAAEIQTDVVASGNASALIAFAAVVGGNIPLTAAVRRPSRRLETLHISPPEELTSKITATIAVLVEQPDQQIKGFGLYSYLLISSTAAVPIESQNAALCAFRNSNESGEPLEKISPRKRKQMHIFAAPIIPGSHIHEMPLPIELLRAAYSFVRARQWLNLLDVQKDGIFIVFRVGSPFTIKDHRVDLIEDISELSPDLIQDWISQIRFRVKTKWNAETLQQWLDRRAHQLDVVWNFTGALYTLMVPTDSSERPVTEHKPPPCG